MKHLTFVDNIEQEVGDGEMRGYDLKKVLEDMLEDIDENEEIREYAEEMKWLCEYIEGLNNKKQCSCENKEIESVTQNYIIEWVVWGMAMLRKDITTKVSLLYSSFCFQISNMILGIYKLAKDGLDYQAMCLVRVLLEMLISFLAILIDSNYRDKYFETADISKEYQIWRSRLKMQKAEEIVWNYAETIGEEVKILCHECKKIYEEMYAELSKFEHNSYVNMIALQFAVVGEDRLGLNINGNNVTAIERILKKVLYILVPMEALFSRIIFEGDVLDCSLPEDEFGQEIWSFAMLLHIMVSDLAQKYFQDSEEN